MKKRRTLAMLTSIIVIGAFLTSCKPTPDAPIVISKGDGKLQDIIYGASAPALSAPYSVPESWVENIDYTHEYKFLVEINAKITVPDSSCYPVFRVSEKELEQSNLTTFITALSGDEKLYDYGERTESDEHLRHIIEKCEYQLNDPTSPLHTQYNDSGEDQSAYDMIKSIAEQTRDNALRELSMKNTGVEVTPSFDYAKNSESNIKYLFNRNLSKRIGISAEKSGKWVSYNINNESNRGIIQTYPYTHNLIETTIDLKSAREKADEALKSLGFSDWNMVNVGAVGIQSENFEDILWDKNNMRSMYDYRQCYWFTYTPNFYESLPILYYSNNDKMYNKNTGLGFDGYAPPDGFMPSLHIAIGDEGLCYCILHSAMSLEDKINDNVPLISFDKVQAIFKNYIKTKINFSNDYENHSGTYIDSEFIKSIIRIDNICLGYMRAKEINSSKHMLIPVWMFYGCQSDEYDPAKTTLPLDSNNERYGYTPAGFTFLIINAIDGSIIDPLRGY